MCNTVAKGFLCPHYGVSAIWKGTKGGHYSPMMKQGLYTVHCTACGTELRKFKFMNDPLLHIVVIY